MNPTPSHPLFKTYPLDGQAEIATGPVPIPYHTYDGHGLLIGGTATFDSVTALLQNEQVVPIRTQTGPVPMGIWVVDFTQASLGPHLELQLSFLVSHQPSPPVKDHPLVLLKALFINPEARIFCWRLWNDTETAVAYNRELLGLNAEQTVGAIDRWQGQTQFRFTDNSGALLFAGQIHKAPRTPPSVGWSLLRLLGLRHTIRASSQPYLAARVVNPISDVIPYNGDGQTYLAADTPVVRFFDAAVDEIVFGQTEARQLDFHPGFVEQFAPFRFVYLAPDPDLTNR